jgi:hypothetical protein
MLRLSASTGLRTENLKAHYTADSCQQLATSFPLQATGQIATNQRERDLFAFMP